MDKAEKLMKIATMFSVIIGIIVTLAGLYDAKKKVDLSQRALLVSNLRNIRAIVKDHEDIELVIENFLKKSDEPMHRASAQLNKHNGRDVFFSGTLDPMRKAGQHFEGMGALVRLGYLPFDLIFTRLPFPDEFYVGSKPLRHKIQANWFGKGKTPDDLWAHFDWLACSYYRQKLRQNNNPGQLDAADCEDKD